MKKVFAVIMAIALILVCFTACGRKVVDKGTCGKNITWTYYDDATLVFSGSGSMYEYYEDQYYIPGQVKIPWYEHAKVAKKIVIEDGITSICRFAFLDASRCESIEIPSSVTKIGACAFQHTNINNFVLPKSVNYLGVIVFFRCQSDIYYEGTSEDFDAIFTDTAPWEEEESTFYWNTHFFGELLFYSETEAEGCWRYVDGVPTEYE